MSTIDRTIDYLVKEKNTRNISSGTQTRDYHFYDITLPHARCHYSNRTGWMDMGHHSYDRTPPHTHVPDAITATESVGWTWDITFTAELHPMPPCLMPLQQPNWLDGHGTSLL
ncbi:hypothetical protein AVEN_134693-1 [Araneus ventricosus]|uniref:Uncharacterized protein n=1 Tax=Araneus ventricosus TaxID=182803 RepID=A0A4Y2HWA1_ARAVE|nr:hypothetical protein AVEN_134693-1 [Araneus ventricosus]